MKREPNTEYILSLSYGKDSIACLEAIKELGYPLDRIIHAEVWATDTIPADLPPMVEFKTYADKIIKEKYGIEVEHICAVRGGGGVRNLPTKSNFMSGLTQEETKIESMDSLTHSERGVIADSKLMPCQELEKITYEKLFYHIPNRRKKPQERERERERERETAGNDTEQVAERTHNSKSLQCEQSILGFPIPKGTWCNSNLKLAALRISNLNRQRELVYSTQTTGFQIAPLCEAQRKISCSTLE